MTHSEICELCGKPLEKVNDKCPNTKQHRANYMREYRQRQSQVCIQAEKQQQNVRVFLKTLSAGFDIASGITARSIEQPKPTPAKPKKDDFITKTIKRISTPNKHGRLPNTVQMPGIKRRAKSGITGCPKGSHEC